ncbi:RING finger protein 122-like [Spea bombifrons]|uniref:RING finger protein 122-like n=1 Tax=Spea bombifrons TaxID=233779 RepID=UPI0023496AEE|nr:RING finger protein 122-like [Spea bombifrons]XP_053306398.1 RING finger protein 122-like [Spea bombifrons]
MTREVLRGVPLNFIVLVFGAGLLLFIFCFIFCCYFFRLKQQEQYQRRGYRKITLKEKPRKANLVGQVCAVCLEEFKVNEELGLCPCNHAFHTKCLMKWLEVRNSCPMCNKTISVTLQRPALERM